VLDYITVTGPRRVRVDDERFLRVSARLRPDTKNLEFGRQFGWLEQLDQVGIHNFYEYMYVCVCVYMFLSHTTTHTTRMDGSFSLSLSHYYIYTHYIHTLHRYYSSNCPTCTTFSNDGKHQYIQLSGDPQVIFDLT
jgi:hypothetical protein